MFIRFESMPPENGGGGSTVLTAQCRSYTMEREGERVMIAMDGGTPYMLADGPGHYCAAWVMNDEGKTIDHILPPPAMVREPSAAAA